MKKPPQQELDRSEEHDLGTDQLQQRWSAVEAWVELGEGKKKVAKVLNHPLDRYHARKEIITDQYRAGCWLFNDWSSSHHHRGIAVLLGNEKGLGIVDYENPHSSFERYMRAVKSLGPISRKLAINVCIEGFTLNEIRMHFPWSARNNGMDRLRETLDELDCFYREQWQQKRKWQEQQEEKMLT